MRRLMLLVFAAFMLAAFACGDDDDDTADGTPDAGETPSVEGTASTPTIDDEATPTGFVTSTPAPPLPTPTPVPDDSPVVTVVFGGTTYQPTAAQFSALGTTTLSGVDGEGVLLSTLAAEVGAPQGSLVTMLGQIEGEGTLRFLRAPLADCGQTTILILGESGQIAIASTHFVEVDWLDSTSDITFE